MLLFLIVAAIGILPSLVWLIFFVSEDNKPEPKKVIAIAFLVGVVITLFVSGALNLFEISLKKLGIQNLILDQNFNNPIFIGLTGTLILLGFAFIEELGKFFAVFISVRKRKEFDQPVDVMIYLVVAALGFATVENIAANWKTVETAASIGSVVQVSVIRFVGAALLHVLASATVGFYWARGLMVGRIWGRLIFGLVFATILHAAFNYLILLNSPLYVPTIFLMIFAFFIFVDFERLKKIDSLPMK